MVCLAIDGMWQVFNLHIPTRNDFIQLLDKNGILIRLVNTLHILIEATRLASAGGGGAPISTTNGVMQHTRSGPLEPCHPFSSFLDTSHPHSG